MNRKEKNNSKDIENLITDLTTGPERLSGMFVFFCWGDAFYSKLISRVTGGPSHAGIGFYYENRESRYFEALFGKGVVGPRPFTKVKDWFLRSPKTRNIDVIPINGFTPEQCALKLAMAHTYVDTAGYGEMQMLAMYLFYRFGFRVPSTPGRVVCSEFVARLLSPEIELATKDRSYDEISPAYLYHALRAKGGEL